MSKSEMIVADELESSALAEQFQMFKPDSQMALALEANMDDGGLAISDLPRVPFPAAGGTTWEYTTVLGERQTKSLEGIIVFRQRFGLLWPSGKNDGAEKSSPIMETTDMNIATLRGEVERDPETGRIVSFAGMNKYTPDGLLEDVSEKEIFDTNGNPTGSWKWNELRFTQFGTAENGIGKYAAERMLLLVLLPESHIPVVVNVPPGSLKIAKNFIAQLPSAYWRCVVKLSLTKITAKADPYSQLTPSLVQVVPAEHGPMLDKINAQMKSSYGSSPSSLIDGDVN